MDFLTQLGHWIADNESLLSGLAAIILLLGVTFSASRLVLGMTKRREAVTEREAVPDKVKPITLKELSAPAPYPVQFVRSGDANIAYAVMGEGPMDLMLAPGIISHLHMLSHLPPFRDMFDAMSALGRIVTFDKRGQGLSDPSIAAPSLAQRMQDMKAVLDAADMERVVLVGVSEGGTMSLQFAHDYPERVRALVLVGSTASWVQRDDYPIGIEEKTLDSMPKSWGTGVMRHVLFPAMSEEEMDDATYRAFERLIATRESVRQVVEFMKTVDVRPLLPKIACPTLVLHFSGDLAVPTRMGRDIARHIKGAEYVEVEGTDHADISHSPQAMARLRDFLAALP